MRGHRAASIGSEHVSIPERVWGVLMLAKLMYRLVVRSVSIPERVWGVLMHVAVTPAAAILAFQSLRGFGGF